MNKIATEIADQIMAVRPHTVDTNSAYWTARNSQWIRDCEAVAVALENLEIIKNPAEFLISAGAWESSTAEGR